MKIPIVVDANPIISSLIGGFSREVLFRHDFEFVTTAFTIQEVKKYLPVIIKKSGVQEKLVFDLLNLLPLQIHPSEYYEDFRKKAQDLIADPKDVDILALALKLKCPVWSEDKVFEQIKEIKLLKTKDFV
ncbi:PIN domain nuclease [Candidatus Woesearchaeota archaeon]|nr:PIN domain nuclease [Candidatus Woesearchaeota archaeon]